MTAEKDRQEALVDGSEVQRSGPYKPTLDDFMAHYDLLLDGLEAMWDTADRYDNQATKDGVVEAFKTFRQWHKHDQEDEHCDPECPAWYRGAYCGSCGVQHRTVRPEAPL